MTDTITFEQVLDLITQATTIIALLLLYKSVPADVERKFRQSAGEAADKTETPADNILLQIYDYLHAIVGGKKEETPTPAPEPLYNPADADRN